MPYVVVVTDSSTYAARFDIIAAIIGDQVLPPIAFSPEDREKKRSKELTVKC